MTKPKRRPICVLAVLTVLSCWGQPGFAQGPPAMTTVYTLEPGEEILRAESTIAISAEAADVILVLAGGKGQSAPFFVFRDGKKTGPYAKLEDAMKAAYAGREESREKRNDCAAYMPGDPPDGARPMPDSAAGGKQVVKFKGKTFGPYLMILAAKATPDGATAYYTASDNEKAWFGCSDGRVVSFGGIPVELKFSPDGRNAAALVQGKLTMGEMSGLAKLPPERLAAAMEDQEKNYLRTIDGKVFGPFSSSFDSGSFWYPGSSNDLYYRIGNDVFRNGSLLFKAGSFDRCDFYPSADGKAYAFSTYESIVFSDGKSYPFPLDIVVVPRGNKSLFRWITLENDKKLVVYERVM